MNNQSNFNRNQSTNFFTKNRFGGENGLSITDVAGAALTSLAVTALVSAAISCIKIGIDKVSKKTSK